MAPKHDSQTDSGSRWSIEEVKNLFLRPFSGSSKNRGSGGDDRDSATSWGRGLRWSLEDIKDKFFRSSTEAGDKKKSKRKKLTNEEREARRQQRLAARKEKKSKREKERRSNVNGLFDTLGSMVPVKDTKKGQRLSILAAATERLREKKGGKKGDQPEGEDAIMEVDEEEDLDFEN